jgi:anthranilate phosphoribosyltransferase
MRLSGDRKFPVRVNPDDLALAWECEPSQEHENRLEAAVAATMQALAAVDGPAMRAVVLGGGLLVELSGLVPDLATGAAEVRDALESGRAHRRLDELREAIG